MAYFQLVIDTQQASYLQSLQCHINTGFRAVDESVIAYPRRHTHAQRVFFAGGAMTQFLGNSLTITGRSSYSGSLKT